MVEPNQIKTVDKSSDKKKDKVASMLRGKSYYLFHNSSTVTLQPNVWMNDELIYLYLIFS